MLIWLKIVFSTGGFTKVLYVFVSEGCVLYNMRRLFDYCATIIIVIAITDCTVNIDNTNFHINGNTFQIADFNLKLDPMLYHASINFIPHHICYNNS